MELGGNPLLEDHMDRIISFVPPPHLRSLSLTSTTLRNLTSKPKLWKNMNVNKNMIRQQGLPHMFAIKKYEKVRVIDMSRMLLTTQQLVDNLNAIYSSSVEDLNLYHVVICMVPAALLGEVAGKLQKLHLGWNLISAEQTLAVVEACASSTTLKELSLEGLGRNDLRGVSYQKLREAAENLQAINLDWANLAMEQILAVLQASASSLQLTDVSMKQSRLEEVPVDDLTQAVTHLGRFDLRGARMTILQKTSVLQAIIESTCTVTMRACQVSEGDIPALVLREARETGRLVELNI